MRRALALTAAAALAAAGLVAVTAPVAATAAPTPSAAALARAAADAYVAARPAALHPSAQDSYLRQPVVAGGRGLQYVPFTRTYRGLPVRGGDFVVVTDKSGHLLSTSIGQQSRALAVATTPARTPASAAATARTLLPNGKASGTTLVVEAMTATPRLAYQTIVTNAGPHRLTVVTDANTGKVLSKVDDLKDGTGNGAINGPTPFTIQTSGSGSSYSMTDSTRSGISCRNYSSGAVLTGTDDVWGNGNGTVIETGCADALFDVQREWDMLGNWLGRNGINGSGSGFPLRVGLNDLNAFWNGSYVAIGHNQSNEWISSEDVVGHEFGHAIDSTTPGGQSGNGVSEATGDIFGTSTEFWTNEPSPYDVPDFLIGEEINLVGSGPIRNMSDPGSVGDPVCYSSSIPSAETHAAAGPFDHWFFLVTGGQSAAGGSKTSKCNGAVVSNGLGVKDGLRVFYNAMLAKTSGMTYLKYRTATLNAAKNLFPGSCAQFNTVKAAWDAVTVPAQAGDPTCTTGGGPVVNNPGNKTATVGTAISPFTVTASGGTPPYTWSASGLPTGLSIGSSSGTVSGTPSAAGTFTTTVTASGGGTGSATFTYTVSNPGGGCSSPGQKLGNPGFESGNTVWSSSSGVIGQYGGSGEPTHGGTWNAWLDGYGSTHTDTLSQSVTVPAGCTATITFYLHIDTSETTTTTQYDKLTAKFGASTLATYSNLNKATGYVLRTFTVAASGSAQTASLAFTGTEDSSLQTSFVLDDLAVTLS